MKTTTKPMENYMKNLNNNNQMVNEVKRELPAVEAEIIKLKISRTLDLVLMLVNGHHQ